MYLINSLALGILMVIYLIARLYDTDAPKWVLILGSICSAIVANFIVRVLTN